jgi:exodeoxyribonuclease V alpha subunit
MTEELSLRVSAIRSQNPRGIGGCIFTGRLIDGMGDVVDASSYFVVKAGGTLLGNTRVQVGQWWSILGERKRYDREVNGYRVTEWQIDAEDLRILQPSGEHIVTFMAESEDFQGIGLVKARKLWDSFREALYDILDRGDIAALATVLTEESARQVIAAWALNGDTRTLQWLQKSGFDVAVGRKVIAYFGAEAQDKLEEDPYRLLSFCATWKQVDALARNHFKVEEADPRRLKGAVEEALYRIFAEGHTVTPMPTLVSRLESVLSGFQWRDLIRDALSNGLTNGSYVLGAGGNVHLLGPLIMETGVARSIADRLLPETNAPLLDSARVNSVITAYEATEGISLNDEQRLAVHTAAANALSLIIGGAGVGKTTVLKALYQVYDEAGVRIFQTALAGRAAKRMLEATGRSATTLASCFKNIKEEDLAGPAVIVVDEASMVDIITMSRLCELLPSHVRLVMAGDPSQLMPVGPGLVLHAMAGVAGIPQVELKVVKRYGGAIALAAQAVRDGVWPELPNDAAAPISFIPCAQASMAEVIVGLYEQDRANTQILTPRRNSADGAKAINTLCQSRFTKNGRPLLVYLDEFESFAGTGFYLGDQLLCTRNMWDWGLQNGSLGLLTEIEDEPRLLTNADGTEIGYAIGWVLWDDGERRPILESMLDDLELGYAVTVHKAQGSQWPRVIVAITGSRMLDRTLIYTAMTRAQSQVIIVGDADAARRAVEGLPRAHTRNVGLGVLLQQQLLAAAEVVAY